MLNAAQLQRLQDLLNVYMEAKTALGLPRTAERCSLISRRVMVDLHNLHAGVIDDVVDMVPDGSIPVSTFLSRRRVNRGNTL
jgi:hypothetical protein